MDSVRLPFFSKSAPTVTLAEGYINLDLNSRAIRNPAATHLYEADENGIEHILKGDLLIVDCSIRPRPGDVLKVDIEGTYKVRRLVRNAGKLFLVTDDDSAPPYPTNESGGFCCGVVTGLYRASV